MVNYFKRSEQTSAPLAPMPPRELLTPALIKNAVLPPSTTTTTLTAKRRDKPDVAAVSDRAHLHHRILPRPICSSGNDRRRRAPPHPLPTSNNVYPDFLRPSTVRPLPVAPADPHASAGNIPSPPRCVKNVVKCVRGDQRAMNRSSGGFFVFFFALAFVPFFPFWGKKMALKFRIWRSRPYLHSAQTDQWESLVTKSWNKVFLLLPGLLSVVAECRRIQLMILFWNLLQLLVI